MNLISLEQSPIDIRSLVPHLERHERELNALYTIGKILGTQAGQKEMLLDVIDVLENQMGMQRGTIMLLSPDGSELIIEEVKNLDSQRQKEVRYRRGEGIVGRVLQTGKSEIIAKISQEPEFQDRIHVRKKTIQEELSFICVPISIDNNIIGTLSVDLPYSNYDALEEHKRALSIVAALIAYDARSRLRAKLERQALEAENERLRSALEAKYRPENIIGNSNAMRTVYQRIKQVAQSDTTVLIRGESGTGKELVASAIHFNSDRANKPFIKVNCAALSENLIESEIFGHERGAFTGAMFRRIGRFEEAEGGTIFLDEIGDFSPAIQVKILRVIQEREFQRVGSNKTLKTDVRIIAATNKDLEKAVQNGEFRQDLYYRINVFSIMLPPLQERKNDILLLADHFVEQYAAKMKKTIRRISTTAINMMTAYHWPGNVRELENCIEHAVLLSKDEVIHGYDLPPTLQMPDQSEQTQKGVFKQRMNLLEKDMIVDALKRTKGNISAAARDLGITPRMVHYKVNKLNIDNHF